VISKLRITVVLAVGTVLIAGCNTVETVTFSPSAHQSAIVRDGIPAIVSQQKQSIVLVSPSGRGEPANGRVAFTVAIDNLTNSPLNVAVSDIQIAQTLSDGTEVALRAIPYDQLVTEEKQKEVAMALLTGLAAGANAYSAARAGYGNVNGIVYTPHGAAHYSGTYYSPTAAAVAQANANFQNEAMIQNTIATGQKNMTLLDRMILKDNTVMPHEWIGGRVIISAPISEPGKIKSYNIRIKVGNDWHSIDVSQHRRS